MFVVRTERSALGTPHAWDALARFAKMARAGDDPVVTTIGGKTMHPAVLQRWIDAVPRAHGRSGRVRRT